MALPSFPNRLFADFRAVLLRFPLPLAFGLSGSLAGIAINGPGRHLWEKWFWLVTWSWLGISLSLGLALFLESARPRPLPKAGAYAALALALALAWLALQGQRPENWAAMRYALWMTAAHCFVAVTPLRKAARSGDFRAFNLLVFSRVALSLVFTLILFLGLWLAIEAVDKLFRLTMARGFVVSLWYLLLGTFNTAFFLAGLPRNWNSLGETYRPSQALRVLSRFILLPLAILYLVILYAYAGRALLLREWPTGWVSALVIVFSGLGILTHLLQDVDAKGGNRWVTAYSRAFYLALVPLILLLGLAVWRRVSEYGLTEWRYIGFAICAWLALVALYFLLARKPRLEAIPLTLGAAALVISIGPWSALEVSLRSQFARAQARLDEAGRLKDGFLVKGGGSLDRGGETALRAAVDYLRSRKRTGRLMALYAPLGSPCRNCLPRPDAFPETGQFLADLGLPSYPYGDPYGDPRVADSAEGLPVEFQARKLAALEIHGFDWLVPNLDAESPIEQFEPELMQEDAGGPWFLRWDNPAVIVFQDGREIGRIPVDSLARRMAQVPVAAYSTEVGQDTLALAGGLGNIRYRLELSDFVILKRGDSTVVDSWQGRLLLAASAAR